MSTSSKLNVLISLYKGYGLGDASQVSAILRHVVKYRPHWHIDFQAEPGRHCVGCGIVASTFAYGEPYPSPHYDAEVQIVLYDTWANWGDRPNTRVSSCLHETFGLAWDRECGRYVVNVSNEARDMAAIVLNVIEPWPRQHSRVVAIHYQGDSSPDKKNLTHRQAEAICKHIKKLGRVPLLLDWRNTSPLRYDYPTLGGQSFSQEWGRDAEMNCAIISQCEAFIGIDSGPGKCASATDTPALITWTGHHPAPFHDPAENTTHLVPKNYHGLEPVCNNAAVIDWFEQNYNVRSYESDPVTEIKQWLKEVLR